MHSHDKLTSYQYLGFDSQSKQRVYWGGSVKKMQQNGNLMMSLRLGTGIVGHIGCRSGDSKKVPKGPSEVMIGEGERGIQKLLELGALPCVACESGDTLRGMSHGIVTLLRSHLGGELIHATDFTYLTQHYDAGRLDWLSILPLFAEYEIQSPSRLYVRPNLSAEAIRSTRELFTGFGIDPPKIGFFDKTKPDRFTQYP